MSSRSGRASAAILHKCISMCFLVALMQDRHGSGLLESQTDVLVHRGQSVKYGSQAEIICGDSEVSITLYGHKTLL